MEVRAVAERERDFCLSLALFFRMMNFKKRILSEDVISSRWWPLKASPCVVLLLSYAKHIHSLKITSDPNKQGCKYRSNRADAIQLENSTKLQQQEQASPVHNEIHFYV